MRSNSFSQFQLHPKKLHFGVTVLLTLMLKGWPVMPAFGQTNLIRNGNFEAGQAPDCWGQADRADYWQSAVVSSGALMYHSPDYYDDDVNFYAASQCTAPYGQGVGEPRYASNAYAGDRYIGMGAYELIQQHLNQVPEPNDWYTVSLYIAPNFDPFDGLWQGGTGRLKVGLAKDEVAYQSGSNDAVCTQPFVSYAYPFLGGQDIMTIGSLDLDINLFAGGITWKRVSFSFRAPSPNIGDFDFLFIEVQVPGFGGSSTPDDQACIGDFVYIDEVALVRSEACWSICSPEPQPISHTALPHAMTANAWNPDYVEIQPFLMNISGAIGIDFRVYASWQFSATLWEQHAFDVNGLKDPGYPDYQLSWIGELADGSTLPAMHGYLYDLTIWNCDPGETKHYVGEYLYYEVGNGEFIQAEDIRIFELADCCEDFKYYQNITFADYSRTAVHEFITAGSAVTNGPQGPVVVASTAFVDFYAGESINLMPGFSVEFGGVYRGKITDCSIYSSKSLVNRGRLPIRGMIHHNNRSISAFPNPTNDGSVTIQVPPLLPDQSDRPGKPFQVDVFDALGKEVQPSTYLSITPYTLKLTLSSQGSYFLVLRDENGAVVYSTPLLYL